METLQKILANGVITVSDIIALKNADCSAGLGKWEIKAYYDSITIKGYVRNPANDEYYMAGFELEADSNGKIIYSCVDGID